MEEQVVYLLLEDADQTLHSHYWPTGVAVTSEDEAKRWVGESAKSSRDYKTIKVRERA